MRTLAIALGLLLTSAACGSTDDADQSDSTTSTLWAPAEEVGELRANQPPTDAEQDAALAAARALEEFVDACVEGVPVLAYLGDKQATGLWAAAERNEVQLRTACTELADTDPTEKTKLEKSMRESREIIDSGEVAPPAATTTTIDPAVAQISITCPEEATGVEGAYRATFEVESSSPTDIREWGVDYGDGRSYKAGSQSSAESELYWHDYFTPGSYEVIVWIVDADDTRAEASCLLSWSS